MDDSIKHLKSQLRELKLKYLAAKLDDFITEASHHEKNHIQFLREALDVEIGQRRQAGMDKRLRYANLPVFDKALDLNLFDFGKRRGITKRQILELSGNFLWIDKAYNVLSLEGPGWKKVFWQVILVTRLSNPARGCKS